MQKIHVTRQFVEASGRHADFFRKNNKPVLDKVNGSTYAKFQVCVVFRLARRRDTNKYIHTYTSEIMNIIDRLLILKRVKNRKLHSFDERIANFGFLVKP